MSKFSVDIHFSKSANFGVHNWTGEARDKKEAEQLAIADARSFGYKSPAKKADITTIKEQQ